MKNDLQVSNLRSQLAFVMGENDSLRKEVKSLSRTLESTKSVIMDMSTSHSSNAFIEGLG
jgi:regulator of replication initiation timing